jgi:hypothetical protein
VEAAELFDGLGQDGLDACVVGDVAREEGTGYCCGNLLAGTSGAINDRDARSAVREGLGGCASHARRPPDDDCEFAFDIHDVLLVR